MSYVSREERNPSSLAYRIPHYLEYTTAVTDKFVPLDVNVILNLNY
jgi:hypothetical protein